MRSAAAGRPCAQALHPLNEQLHLSLDLGPRGLEVTDWTPASPDNIALAQDASIPDGPTSPGRSRRSKALGVAMALAPVGDDLFSGL